MTTKKIPLLPETTVKFQSKVTGEITIAKIQKNVREVNISIYMNKAESIDSKNENGKNIILTQIGKYEAEFRIDGSILIKNTRIEHDQTNVVKFDANGLPIYIGHTNSRNYDMRYYYIQKDSGLLISKSKATANVPYTSCYGIPGVYKHIYNICKKFEDPNDYILVDESNKQNQK